MSNKGMLTQKYNYKKVVDNTTSNCKDTFETTSDYGNDITNDSTENWYVRCHNKPKVTDRNKLSYTNTTRARCRRVGNIWIEPERNTWRLSEIEIEQQKLYNKLKREWLKEQSQEIKDINARVREVETTNVIKYNKHNISDCIAFNRHRDIVRMSMG